MKLEIRRPIDMHVHFREGATLRAVVPETARHFRRALAMPNVPAIHDGDEAIAYCAEILEASRGHDFDPILSIKLTHRTTPAVIRSARDRNVLAAKLYPEGATTASHDGIRDPRVLWPVFRAMQDCGMVLCVHGEAPGSFVLDRERDYLSIVSEIVRNFPGLKVVLEHVTTREAVEFVELSSVNVAATITAHHLWLTLDDVVGSGIRPHHFCYPLPKRPEDRRALRRAACQHTRGRFFFGSDSAPHPRGAKESACGCAGVFSSPVALAVLAEFFLGDERHKGHQAAHLGLLERFASVAGAEFYGLPADEGTITLERSDWEVPAEVAGIVPYRAGEWLGWRVAD